MSKPSRALRPTRLIAGALLLAAAASPVSAQSSDPRAQAQPQPPPPAKQAEPPKNKTMVEKYTEAGRSLGGPAANPECVWHGQRIVNLLYNNDMDTAFRHLDMYERFGCPSGHIQASFRCVLWQGDPDMKDPKQLVEQLQVRVHNCWINPTMPPAEATAAAPPPAGAAPTAKQ